MYLTRIVSLPKDLSVFAPIFTILWPHLQIISFMLINFSGAYLKPPLNFTVISIGSEARLESKIKGKGGAFRLQRYNKIFIVPNFLMENYTEGQTGMKSFR